MILTPVILFLAAMAALLVLTSLLQSLYQESMRLRSRESACLDYFNRKEKLRAGVATNMFTIAESLMQAGSVIRP